MKKGPLDKNSQSNVGGKKLHTNSLHNHGYDFPVLIKSHPALRPHVKTNKYQNDSIDFSDPSAVKALNRALLQHHYGIVDWDIPDGFLCPPIPGRVDYIHYVAELLGEHCHGQPKSTTVRMLDIGTGANGVYALLASQVYGWNCTASDIDPLAIENVSAIVRKNPSLVGRIELRLQEDKSHIFEGIIRANEYYDLSVCNPPFHASLEEALKGSQKKLDNLAAKRKQTGSSKTAQGSPLLNFGGQKAELWCKGGEIRFLRKMLKESKVFSQQCRWFTTLVSKSENLKPALKLLRKLEAAEVKEIEMKQGNKVTRILAWTFSSRVS